MFCVCGFAVPCDVVCDAGLGSRFAFVFYVCGFKVWWFVSNLVFGDWLCDLLLVLRVSDGGWWFCVVLCGLATVGFGII